MTETKKENPVHQVGIISDSHGLVPSDMYQKLDGMNCIIHAGDLGSSDVLLDLEAIAPVYAVRGNIDFFDDTAKLPTERFVTIGPVKFAITHGDRFQKPRLFTDLLEHFQSSQVDVIVFGHTHQYYVKRHGDIWLVNPGSSNCNFSPSGIILTYRNKRDLDFRMIEFCESKEEDFDDDYYNHT